MREAPSLEDSVRTSLLLTDGSWTDPALVRELCLREQEAHDEPDQAEWLLLKNPRGPHRARATLLLEHPQGPAEDAPPLEEFLQSVRWQVEQAFESFAAERGWPVPGWSFHLTQGPATHWSYRTEGTGWSELVGRVEPSKYLVIGAPSELERLLGLETVDPVFRMPAKWIARSQLSGLDGQTLTIFDGPGAIACHLLSRALGQYAPLLDWAAVWVWLAPAFRAESPALVPSLVSGKFPQIFSLLVRLIDDDLWLNGPGPFCEAALRALEEGGDHESAYRLLRPELLPANLPRWRNAHGELKAVEWKGETEMLEEAASRRVKRLLRVLLEPGDERPGVIVTDRASQPLLRTLVRRHCERTPVLAWEELPEDLDLCLVATVDGSLDLDPSPWQLAEFTFAEFFPVSGNIPEEIDV